MKKLAITLTLLVSINCANIYSPTGIKGKDALKDIEEYRSTLSFASLPILFSSLSSSSSSSSSSSDVTCTTEGVTSASPVGVTSASNFSIPADSSSVIDLVAPGGTVYFRSAASQSSSSFFIRISSLKTSTVTTQGTCTYNASIGACGTNDLSLLTYSSSVGSIFQNSCLAARCTTPAVIRITQSPTSSSFSSSSASSGLLLSLLEPEIFKSTTGIEDGTYYTKESFEKCKEDITVIGGLQIADLSASVGRFATASACNLPASSLSPALPSSGYTLLQANACKLEPVNFIGL